MSVAPIVRRDLRDAARSRLLVVLVAVFTLLTAVGSYLFVDRFVSTLPDQVARTVPTISFLAQSMVRVVPLIALVTTTKAVVGERSSGSLKLLLSQPHTRRDVLLGKFLGRTAVLVGSVVVGFAVGGVVVAVMVEGFELRPYATFVLVTAGLAAAFGSIGLCVSAVAEDWNGAAAVAATVIVLDFVWLGLFGLTRQILGYELGAAPTWVALLYRLNPGIGYRNALRETIDGFNFGNEVPPAALPADPSAFYFQDWFGLVVLAAWIVVPVVVGYLVFDRADL